MKKILCALAFSLSSTAYSQTPPMVICGYYSDLNERIYAAISKLNLTKDQITLSAPSIGTDGSYVCVTISKK